MLLTGGAGEPSDTLLPGKVAPTYRLASEVKFNRAEDNRDDRAASFCKEL
jgi:hypothetical protein